MIRRSNTTGQLSWPLDWGRGYPTNSTTSALKDLPLVWLTLKNGQWDIVLSSVLLFAYSPLAGNVAWRRLTVMASGAVVKMDPRTVFVRNLPFNLTDDQVRPTTWLSSTHSLTCWRQCYRHLYHHTQSRTSFSKKCRLRITRGLSQYRFVHVQLISFVLECCRSADRLLCAESS